MNKFSLEKQPKIKSGFTVPVHYFEQFPEIVLKETSIAFDKKPKLTTIKPWFIAAAAIIIVALGISFYKNNSAASLEEIDTATLENYITYQSTISSYDVINLMNAQEIDAMKVDMNFEDQSLEDILTSNPNFENDIID